MAPSCQQAIATLKEMEKRFDWEAMNISRKPIEDGPVFLKANQKTGEIYIRRFKNNPKSLNEYLDNLLTIDQTLLLKTYKSINKFINNLDESTQDESTQDE